jgi:ER lumen protein retaining receptor
MSDKAQLAGTVYAYSWNYFRYSGDFLHLAGIVTLLTTIVRRQSVSGLSQKTQLLYCLIYCTRYLDLLDHKQAAYLVVFKITFIFTSFVALSAFQRFGETWERTKDTCTIGLFIFPCLLLSLFMTTEYTVLETLWTFSEFLEAVAMVPQYIFSYRDRGNRDYGVNAFVILIGSYRIMYCLNWMYKKYEVPQYSDIDSWLAGLVEIILFVDFLNFKFRGVSTLRQYVLAVDLKVHEAQEKVERKVFGGEKVIFENSETGELRRRKRGAENEGMQLSEAA